MHVFKHPKYYKELRKRNRAGSIDGAMLPDSQSDQVISLRAHDGECERAPGQGLKQQAIDETVPHCDIEEASSTKPQAPSSESIKPQASSPKQQASSSKPQASSSKILEPR